MSVINQMLRDLDARAASERERAGLPARLRPLPPASAAKRNGKRLALFAIGLALSVVTAMAFFRFAADEKKEPRQAMPNAVSPLSAALLPPVVVASPLPPSAERSDSVSGGDQESMRLALSLDVKTVSPMPAVAASQEKKEEPLEGRQDAALPPRSSHEERGSLVSSPPQHAVAQRSLPSQVAVVPKEGLAQKEADARYRQGMAALYRGERETAERHLLLAIERDPQAAAARQALLAVLIDARRFAEARALAEEGLRLQPQRAEWALIAARLQYEAGERQTAQATLERHAAYAERIADYQGFLAFLLDAAGRRQEAAERYRRAASLKPGEGRWWYGLGVTLESLGDRDGAREAFRQALASGALPAELAVLAEKKAR